MKEKYTLKLFIGFLKKNNVYDAYIKSLIECNSPRFIDPLNFIIRTIKVRPRSIIADAFDWRSCKYCPNKWYDLHMEWCTLYNKLFD
jgi:hypothetical protein